MHAKFIKSAPSLADCPTHSGFEVALLGRSNAGKSALINALTKQKSLARVSQKPGKTEYLNYYQIETDFYLVDTPGYGYAARREEQRESWSPMIEEYLQSRENLKGVVIIVDCIREWTVQEEDLVNWLNAYQRPVLLAVNKIDRLNQKELAQSKKRFSPVEGVIGIDYISAEKGTGMATFSRNVYEKLLRGTTGS